MKSGVYIIENTVNGKVYVGSSVSFIRRWQAHKRLLGLGKHPSIHLQRAWVLCGEAIFVFKKLIVCAKQDLLMYEQRAIDSYSAVKRGYNMALIAGSPMSGRKHGKDAKEKMSAAHSGKKYTLGYKHSDEAKENMAAAQRGRKHSLETKAKMSLSSMGNKSNLGQPRSQATKDKISATLKGRIVSIETRAKLSVAAKEQHLRNRSAANV